MLVYAIAYFGFFMAFFFILSYEPKLVGKDPKPKRFPYVSIIIPAYNEEKVIGKTINSVLKLDYPKDKYEIIVVDDGSTDKTFKVAKRFTRIKKPKVKVFKKPNGGVASAKNYGIKKAKGEIIVTLDADSFASEKALKKMVGYFDDKRVMAVTASLNVYNTKSFLEKLQWAEYMTGIFLRKVFANVDAVHVIPGPFSAFRKEFFERYGGFDENNVTEDTEIAMRIQSKGYKIENSITASIYTVVPNRFVDLLKQRIRWYYGFVKNSLKYKRLLSPRKYGDLGLLILPSAFLSVLFAIVSSLIFFRSLFQGIAASIKRFQTVGYAALNQIFKIKLEYIKEGLFQYLTNPLIFFIIIGVFFCLLWIIRAKQGAEEKRSMKSAFLYFFLTYGFFYAFWWITMFIYKFVLRKKIKWGPRYY